MRCFECPIECGADRSREAGACGVGERSRVARAALHAWEEPCISGARGSGAVFFSGCNMRCVFCQNAVISRDGGAGAAVGAAELAGIMLRLETLGAHNINFVTPSPHVELLCESIPIARAEGLRIPVVYNTNSYEKASTLKRLEGLVDVYLPDLKYISPDLSARFSATEDYFKYASAAIEEMYRQCGALLCDDSGIARRGVLIRHMTLPRCGDDSRAILEYIVKAYGINAHVSLMSQYVPCADAHSL
ncbi:MAG: radical SAM protein [Clostridia bacterium]|nr:radical SAM protein [Clostridia bacterium]